MPGWRLQIARNTIKAAVPFKRQARLTRARITGAPVPAYQTSVISGAYEQTGALREIGFGLEGKRAMEIGSGWHPIMPLMFRLAGCSHVVMTDVHRLLQPPSIDAAVNFLRQRRDAIIQSLPVTPERFDAILGVDLKGSLEQRLAALGLSYHMAHKGWGGLEPVDLIFSHTCLEHIEPALLASIFRDARAILRPGGVMSHGIDHSDHRANRDPNLSRIDFLRYSDRVWKLLCIDPQDYCSRLRHSDYVAMFAACGFDILRQELGAWDDIVEEAGAMQLAGRFQDMDPRDLATLWTHFIVRPA